MKVDLAKLKPGTKVRSDFHSRWRFVPPSDKPEPDVEADMIRTLERIERDARCESGYRVWMDAGEPCACCGRPFSEPIHGVDGEWISAVVSDE